MFKIVIKKYSSHSLDKLYFIIKKFSWESNFVKVKRMFIKLGLIISIISALFLFSYSYMEALNIANTADEKVYGGSFLFFTIMAFVFTWLSNVFLSLLI